MLKLGRCHRHVINLLVIILLVFSFALVLAQQPASSQNGMVATAHPLATRAALQMLQQGGNAIDAAVAAAFAIGVVEPDGSGLGGGGYLVFYDAQQKQGYAVNFYQKASSEINNINFDRKTDRFSAKAILVPGNVAGLVLALQKFGTLPLPVILEPAIQYAEKGFPIDGTLAQIILDQVILLQADPETAASYLPDGFPLMEGDTLRQPKLAKTLRNIAEKGHSGFYEGPIADSLVAKVTRLGGALTHADLKSYQAEIVEPVHGTYRGYAILSAQTPQAGPSIIEAMNILEKADIKSMGHYSTSAPTLHFLAEVFRRVYADRSAYLEDPHFSQVPVNELISKALAYERFKSIDMKKPVPEKYRQTPPVDMERFKIPHRPDGITEPLPPDEASPKDPSIDQPSLLRHESVSDFETIPPEGHTTHLSVMDKEGNSVSLTQTLGTFFGSGVTVEGVLLNASLANFSETTRVNSLAPGKMPRSTIAPTILIKGGEPFLSIGSPGAGRIISTIVQVLVNIIDFHMNLQQANDAPRFHCQKFDDFLHLEDRIPESVRTDLTKAGHNLRVYGAFDLFFGGVQMVQFDASTRTFYGSADQRRGGTAGGE